MPSRKPNHADADLVLKLYDLRREPVMRESRQAMLRWMPKSFEDVRAIMDFAHPDNAAYRQVSSFFEYSFAFAHHGIVPADFLAEFSGEGLLLYAKIEPFLAELRAATAPTAFGHAEWITKNSKWAKSRMKLFRARIAAARDGASPEARKPEAPKPKPKKRGRKGRGK